MSDGIEAIESVEVEIEKKVRSRFRVVLVHVLKSAVFLPFPIKYVLFAFIAIAKPPLAVSVVLWAVGCVAVYVFSVRRSLSSIRKKVSVVNPERCIVPSLIAFGLFALFNIFIDLPMSINSGTDAGPLILLSVLLNLCIFTFQSVATEREFAAMADTDSQLPARASAILIAASDLVIVASFLIIIISAINGAF